MTDYRWHMADRLADFIIVIGSLLIVFGMLTGVLA